MHRKNKWTSVNDKWDLKKYQMNLYFGWDERLVVDASGELWVFEIKPWNKFEFFLYIYIEKKKKEGKDISNHDIYLELGLLNELRYLEIINSFQLLFQFCRLATFLCNFLNIITIHNIITFSKNTLISLHKLPVMSYFSMKIF